MGRVSPHKDFAKECSNEEIRDQDFPEELRFLQNIFGSTKIGGVSNPIKRNGLWVAKDWKDCTCVPAERLVVLLYRIVSQNKELQSSPKELISFITLIFFGK
jgi:hypothetical protein